jgi:hypothetical protein
MDSLDKYANVVAENFAESFIKLSRITLGA